MLNSKEKANQKHQKIVAKKRKIAQKKAAKTLHKLVKDIDDHPHNYHTYYDLGTFLVELHNYTQAEELFMKALGLFAEKNVKAKNTLLYGLGNVYYAAGSFDKAIKTFMKVKDNVLKINAYIMLAQSYMSQKDYKRAVVFALTAHGWRKQDPTINALLGSSFLALGDCKQAGHFYDEALVAKPENGKYYFNRGLCALVNGEDFHHYFNLAKKYDPKYVEKGQKRVADIERFIQVNQKKSQK